MDAGEIIQRIITLVVVMRLIRGIQQRFTGNKDAAPKKAKVGGAAPPLESPAARIARRARLTQRLQELNDDGEALERRLDRVHGVLNAEDPPVRVLRQHLAGPLRHRLALARRALAESLRDAQMGGDDALEDQPVVARAAAALAEVSQAVSAAGAYADSRSNPKNIKRLQDAAQVASDLLQRWPTRLHHARRGAPVVLSGLSMRPAAGLFGEHPVLLVGADLEDEPAAWAELAGGVGRAALTADPDLARAVRQILGARGPGLLPRPDGQRIRFEPDAAWAAWSGCVFADAVQVLLLGPAGARALLHRWSADDDLHSRLVAEVAADGHHVAAHPPPVLRAPLALHTLELMGFATEARRLRADWLQSAGAPDALNRVWLPTTFGEPIAADAEAMLAPGLRLLDGILTGALPTLGRPLLEFPDFALSAAAWTRAQALVDALLDDRSATAPARLWLIAAVEAEGRRGGSGARIVARMRAGLASASAPAAVAEGLRHLPGTGLALLRDALVLNEVLGTPGGRARRGSAVGPKGLRARKPAAP
jgi:hypothetical protein